MNPIFLDKNNTTKFILPMIFDDDVKYNEILTKDFINAYIADFDKPEYDDHILIACKEGKTSYDELPKPTHQYNKNNLTVFVYDIPENHAEDYFTLIAGMYSLLSESYKQRLLDFWNQEKGSDLDKILNKIIKVTKNDEVYEREIDWNNLNEAFEPFNLYEEILGFQVKLD